MSVVEIILGALLLIASIVLIIIIILQEGNQQGIGVVSGGADTFFSKNKARSYDAFLARATKWFAVGFVVVVIALNIIAYYTTPADSVEATDTTSVSDQVTETTAPEA
ncbi:MULTISPECIES: preprotein translocase subunit SecG [Ruminococcus]|uniref:Protein-export membrane protein SecG n=1 Tax=Ruminococcus difficilis TaxID=2763069 RepID=A0A934TZY2_9FIRM|nr:MULTISPECIES: preprotein translocase subunit SecG [Ruminococcus]MBK6088018.1 preprotein translocase subunit SecG [Ruminococcus difficilis]MEE3492264.1 preprotein translocase subunit SecG [Ruminococcus sp.]